MSAFQSTPPMQGATQDIEVRFSKHNVSIHAPYAGSDQGEKNHHRLLPGFQSTPPMQGATNGERSENFSEKCFNPRPLCRERQLIHH